jgi:hypothetical protein
MEQEVEAQKPRPTSIKVRSPQEIAAEWVGRN